MRKFLNFTILMTILILICLAFFCCKAKEKTFHIGVLQWTENVEAFNQTYKGVIDGLRDKGYIDGGNLKITYRNVEQDKVLALESAQALVKKDKVDLIVALGTGSSQPETSHKEAVLEFEKGTTVEYQDQAQYDFKGR